MKTLRNSLLPAILALVAASQVAHADGSNLFLPSVSSNKQTAPVVGSPPLALTLETARACVKGTAYGDQCAIIDQMVVAYRVSILPNQDKPAFKFSNLSKGTDQSVWLGYEDETASKDCKIGYHIQKQSWFTDCAGPLRGDGGLNTVFSASGDPIHWWAHRFIWALGGDVITYDVAGFWLVDWKHVVGQSGGLCPIDNPFTPVDESAACQSVPTALIGELRRNAAAIGLSESLPATRYVIQFEDNSFATGWQIGREGCRVYNQDQLLPQFGGPTKILTDTRSC